MRYVMFLATSLLMFGLLACTAGRKSASGFHLPDGDVERGRTTFMALKCNVCHRVAGVDLPAPVADPPVPVVLGGRVPYLKTDGELVTSIIDPSYRLAAGYRKEETQSGRLSRMADYCDVMTARQVIDLVAFLQSRYEVYAPPPVR
jgi:L-cysteine S-thiosulfotransferase